MIFDNFGEKLQTIPNGTPYEVDTRTGYSCVNPDSNDMALYFNYINLLVANRLDWKYFGYLDLGMIPLSIAPSFNQRKLNMFITTLCDTVSLPYHVLPPTSFTRANVKMPEHDIWAFREDVERVTGIKQMKQTSMGVLLWLVKNQ